jgi:hypothetical protein
MSTIYNSGLEWIGQTGDIDAAGADIRVALKRDNTTYTESKAHQFVSEVVAAGFTEITSPGYSRQTVASKTLAKDNTGNRVEWDHADVTFGSLPTGQVCNGYLVYVHVGADDAANRVLFFNNTAAGLPLTFNGTEVKLMINAEGHLWFLQP